MALSSLVDLILATVSLALIAIGVGAAVSWPWSAVVIGSVLLSLVIASRFGSKQ